MVEDRRIDELESRVERLARRVERIEAGEQAPSAVEPERYPVPVWSRPAPPPQAPEAAEATAPAARPPVGRLELPGLEDMLRGRTFEDVLGGRVLAWVGGLAVLLGIAFLFAVAVSSGWIGEGARTTLGGLASAALLFGGVWLHEQRGRTDAALASVAAGISGLFVTLTVGAQVYEVLPALLALPLAMGVGALATALALRWEARGIAALGIVGALMAPVLAGASYDLLTMAMLLAAAGSAVAVLLWQRWDWLAFAVFAVTVPQWVAHLLEATSIGESLAVLAGFAAVGVAAAVGYELRVAAPRLRASSAFLLALNAMAVGLGGYAMSRGLGHDTIAVAWLWGLAAAHVGVGLLAGRRKAGTHDFGLLALAIGALLADVAFGLSVDGPLRTIGFAGASVALAALVRRRGMRGNDEAIATLGLGFHLALALMQTLMVDAPPGHLMGGELSAAGAMSLLALAAGCFVSARLAQHGRRELRVVLDVLGLAATAYLTALSLDGLALTVAWSLEAAALSAAGRHGWDALAKWAGLAHLGLALTHALAFEVPPAALVEGLASPGVAALALAAVALAGAVCARAERVAEHRALLAGGVAVTLLYLASALVVTPFQGGAPVADTGVLALDARQQGQVALSALWALVGLGSLVLGLRRDQRAVRLGALALLVASVGKVFMFDLATLTSIYRVISFIVLGLLLLTGAFVWQRLRPGPVPDLREAPAGIR